MLITIRYTLILFLICLFQQVSSQEATKTFRDPDKTISIPLPKSWNYRFIDNGNNTELLITKTYLMNDTGTFNTGVRVSRSKNAVLAFQKGANLLLETRKNQRYEALTADSTFREHGTGQFACGEYLGIIVEISYQESPSKPKLHMFAIWLAGENDLIEVSMIALDEEWAKLKPVYLNSLSEMSIKR